MYSQISLSGNAEIFGGRLDAYLVLLERGVTDGDVLGDPEHVGVHVDRDWKRRCVDAMIAAVIQDGEMMCRNRYRTNQKQ